MRADNSWQYAAERKPRTHMSFVLPFALLSMKNCACMAIYRLPPLSMPGVPCPCITSLMLLIEPDCSACRAKQAFRGLSCLACSVHDVPKSRAC